MKKILKNVFCFLFIISLSILKVNAATIAIGDDSIYAGEKDKSVTVELKDDDLKDYVKVEFELTISGTDYASLVEFTPKPTSMTYTKVNESTYRFEMVATEGSEETSLYATTIGSISYKAEENLNTGFKITPANVKFYKKDGTVMRPGDTGIKIDEGNIKYEKPKSNDASLTNLIVSQGSLSPEFDSDILEYKVSVPDTINSIKITASTAEGASKTGTGTKTLNMGENKFEVVVTAEDGKTKKTYVIIVNRGEVSKPSAYLESLKINNIGCTLSPKFDQKNNKYTVNASKDIKSLDLEYKLEDKNATISIDGNEEFTVGENLITITVKSSDESEQQVYEITVNVSEEEESKPAISDDDGNEENKKEKKSNNVLIIIIIVTVILAIVAGITLVLFKKKKKTKINQNKEDVIKDTSNKVLFEDERTTTYDKKTFIQENKEEKSEDLEKTKEFNFKDFM